MKRWLRKLAIKQIDKYRAVQHAVGTWGFAEKCYILSGICLTLSLLSILSI